MRELRPLTPDLVTALGGRCAPCTFWQTLPHNGHGAPADPVGLLAEWVEQVIDDWGPPGRVAFVDGEPAGHVVIAPARHLPRLAAFATAPSDPGTLMLVTAVVAHPRSSHGLRKALVQSAAKDALRRRARSLDAVAARAPAVDRHACVLDAGLLERAGFRVEREHPVYPRMRIDLRTTVTLRDEAAAYVARALARLPGVRPVPETHPDGATRVGATREAANQG